jgi:hypothetical protein
MPPETTVSLPRGLSVNLIVGRVQFGKTPLRTHRKLRNRSIRLVFALFLAGTDNGCRHHCLKAEREA